MAKQNILLVRTSKRRENVDRIQKVLTEYGCIIRMRLGLHEAGDVCSDEGLLLLQLTDAAEEAKAFEKALSAIDGVFTKLVEV